MKHRKIKLIDLEFEYTVEETEEQIIWKFETKVGDDTIVVVKWRYIDHAGQTFVKDLNYYLTYNGYFYGLNEQKAERLFKRIEHKHVQRSTTNQINNSLRFEKLYSTSC